MVAILRKVTVVILFRMSVLAFWMAVLILCRSEAVVRAGSNGLS
jgi:hypothetical protein